MSLERQQKMVQITATHSRDWEEAFYAILELFIYSFRFLHLIFINIYIVHIDAHTCYPLITVRMVKEWRNLDGKKWIFFFPPMSSGERKERVRLWLLNYISPYEEWVSDDDLQNLRWKRIFQECHLRSFDSPEICSASLNQGCEILSKVYWLSQP